MGDEEQQLLSRSQFIQLHEADRTYKLYEKIGGMSSDIKTLQRQNSDQFDLIGGNKDKIAAIDVKCAAHSSGRKPAAIATGIAAGLIAVLETVRRLWPGG